MAMNPPLRPGENLLDEYLTPMEISQQALARAIGVAPRAINEIVLDHREITPVMSIRFGAFFGQTPEFWHGLQVECDFRALGKKQKQLTTKIHPRPKPRSRRMTHLAVKSSDMTPSRLS
jgi:addiction module HigA family antidote